MKESEEGRKKAYDDLYEMRLDNLALFKEYVN